MKPRYRPRMPSDKGKLWLSITLMSGEELDALIPNKLLRINPRAKEWEVEVRTGEHRIMQRIAVASIAAIIVRGVIGVPTQERR